MRRASIATDRHHTSSRTTLKLRRSVAMPSCVTVATYSNMADAMSNASVHVPSSRAEMGREENRKIAAVRLNGTRIAAKVKRWRSGSGWGKNNRERGIQTAVVKAEILEHLGQALQLHTTYGFRASKDFRQS